jgi:hypothetical protein
VRRLPLGQLARALPFDAPEVGVHDDDAVADAGDASASSTT